MENNVMTPQIQRTLGIEAGAVFHPSSPIGEKDLFAGRLKQIQAIFDVIFQKGLHAIIFGERGVGKTSLANVLTSLMPPQEGPLSSVRITCNTEDTFEAIWYRVFNTMQLTRTETSVGFGADSTLRGVGPGHFFNKSDFFSPDEVRNALLQVQAIYQIIIIDEFDRVDDQTKRMFSDLIKNLSDYAIPATIILIGVGESVDDLIKEHASVFRALKQIQMPRMNNEEIEDIILKGINKLGMRIEKETLTQITLMTQGLPYYAHLLGLYATRAAINNLSYVIKIEHINEAIQKALDDSQQSIKSFYLNAVSSAHKDNMFSDVLLACAIAAKNSDYGEFAAQDVCIPIRKIKDKYYDIPAFARHLNEFTTTKRSKILTKSGESRRFKYKFTDPLMQPYVIMQGLADRTITTSDL